MKNNYVIIVAILMLLFTACKKTEVIDIPKTVKPITIQAQVPKKVYTNQKSIELNAGATSTSNGLKVLNFDWSCPTYPSGQSPKIGSPSSATTKAENLFVGQYIFRLKVWDNFGNQARAEYPVEVIQDTLNGTPKISSLPDQLIQMPINMVRLEGSVNYGVNPQGRPLIFEWRILEKPSGSDEVIFNTTSSADTYVYVSKPGMYRFTLLLKNELGLTISDTIDVTVLADPLAGSERLFENLTWVIVYDEWGDYGRIFINEKDIFKYRNNLNMLVYVWDEGIKDWMATDNWYASGDGLNIDFYIDPALLQGKATKVKVKFL